MPCYIRPKVDEKKIKEGTISMKQKKLLKYILIAMISGILIGWAFHSTLTTAQTTELAAYFKIVLVLSQWENPHRWDQLP